MILAYNRRRPGGTSVKIMPTSTAVRAATGSDGADDPSIRRSV